MPRHRVSLGLAGVLAAGVIAAWVTNLGGLSAEIEGVDADAGRSGLMWLQDADQPVATNVLDPLCLRSGDRVTIDRISAVERRGAVVSDFRVAPVGDDAEAWSPRPLQDTDLGGGRTVKHRCGSAEDLPRLVVEITRTSPSGTVGVSGLEVSYRSGGLSRQVTVPMSLWMCDETNLDRCPEVGRLG